MFTFSCINCWTLTWRRFLHSPFFVCHPFSFYRPHRFVSFILHRYIWLLSLFPSFAGPFIFSPTISVSPLTYLTLSFPLHSTTSFLYSLSFLPSLNVTLPYSLFFLHSAISFLTYLALFSSIFCCFISTLFLSFPLRNDSRVIFISPCTFINQRTFSVPLAYWMSVRVLLFNCKSQPQPYIRVGCFVKAGRARWLANEVVRKGYIEGKERVVRPSWWKVQDLAVYFFNGAKIRSSSLK